MKILKENPSMFATTPTGIVKRNKNADNKFGYINSHNASGQLPTIQPVTTPDPEPTPPAETTPPATPPASEPEKPKDEPAPQKDADNSMGHVIAYGTGALLGGAVGYFITDKYKKNIYGGLLLGGGIVTGGVFLFFNGKDLWNKISSRQASPADAPKSNASGRSSSVRPPATFPCRIEGGGTAGGTGLCRCVNGVIEVQVITSGALGWKHTDKKC